MTGGRLASNLRTMLGDFVQDLRFAVRGLGRHRGFTIIAAVTLAVGIGAMTTVLAIADSVLLGRPPVDDADRLVSIWELREGLAYESVEGRLLPYSRYESYEEATRDVFDGLAAHAYADLSLRTDAGAVALDGFLTSPNYFEVVGVRPAAGRLYTEDEAVVVLSARLWRTRFAADPDLVGSTVFIDSQPFTVAGIAPDGFTGTMFGFGGDAWMPIKAYRSATGSAGALIGDASLGVPIGRLAAGMDRAAATARVAEVARLIPPEHPAVTVQGARLDGITWHGELLSGVRTFIGILVGAALLLLLIACANIAGMVFARAIGRRREVAVRLAIGAGRWRLVRQLLTESLLLVLIGGAGGLLLAFWATGLLSRITIPIGATVAFDVRPDPVVLAVGLGVATLTGILFAVGPALRTSNVDLSTSLKHGGLAAVGNDRTRTAFVIAQFALAVLLLVTAGLFMRSVRAGFDVDLAFEPEGVLVATVDLSAHNYEEARGRAFQQQLIERVQAAPDVESASLARLVPLGGMNEGNSVRAAEWDRTERAGVGSRSNRVSPDWFETMRVPFVAGRAFTAAEAGEARPVAVINQRLASTLWPGENAVGRSISTGGADYEVVGVTRDGRYTFVTQEHAFVFTSLAQQYSDLTSLHVRMRGSPADVRALIERAVSELDPNVAVEDVRLMNDVVELSLFPQRMAFGLTGLFAAIGIVLSTIGIYGVLSLYVAQRTREFGIRMALGAGAGDVLRLVVGRGLVLAALGSAIGLLAALAVTRLVRVLLFGVHPVDPVTFSAVPVLILGAALLACFMPARRATRADPLDALRQE